jgi:hypothetical protein
MSNPRVHSEPLPLAGSLRSLRLRLASKIKGGIEATDQWMASKAKPSVESRRDELGSFYEEYENLVETVCDAAQYGPNPKLERAYENVRRRYQAALEPLRPFLVSYLAQNDPQAFDRLAASDSLAAFLACDDGSVIGQITATREALSRYAEHLRQLAVRGR